VRVIAEAPPARSRRRSGVTRWDFRSELAARVQTARGAAGYTRKRKTNFNISKGDFAMAAVNLKSLVAKLNPRLASEAWEGAAGLCLSRTELQSGLEQWLLKLLEPFEHRSDQDAHAYSIAPHGGIASSPGRWWAI